MKGNSFVIGVVLVIFFISYFIGGLVYSKRYSFVSYPDIGIIFMFDFIKLFKTDFGIGKLIVSLTFILICYGLFRLGIKIGFKYLDSNNEIDNVKEEIEPFK